MDLEISTFTYILLMSALLLVPILALAHMLQHNYQGKTRLVWVLIIVFLPFFGAVLYFLMGKRYRKHNPE